MLTLLPEMKVAFGVAILSGLTSAGPSVIFSSVPIAFTGLLDFHLFSQSTDLNTTPVTFSKGLCFVLVVAGCGMSPRR